MSKHRECPQCGDDLADGEITILEIVDPTHDPENIARLDLILICGGCDRQYNAFVPVEKFTANPVEGSA